MEQIHVTNKAILENAVAMGDPVRTTCDTSTAQNIGDWM